MLSFPTQKDTQDRSMQCFRETWLIEKIPDEAITLDSYSFQRGLQRVKAARLAMEEQPSLSNKSCCTDFKIISKTCLESVEYLTVKLRLVLLASRTAGILNVVKQH